MPPWPSLWSTRYVPIVEPSETTARILTHRVTTSERDPGLVRLTEPVSALQLRQDRGVRREQEVREPLRGGQGAHQGARAVSPRQRAERQDAVVAIDGRDDD